MQNAVDVETLGQEQVVRDGERHDDVGLQARFLRETRHGQQRLHGVAVDRRDPPRFPFGAFIKIIDGLGVAIERNDVSRSGVAFKTETEFPLVAPDVQHRLGRKLTY